jgi:hypothetical protein
MKKPRGWWRIYDPGMESAPWLVDFREEVNSLYWRNPIDEYLQRLSPTSGHTMRAALEDATRVLTRGQLTAEQMPWHRLRDADMLELKRRLARIYAPATSRRILSAVRGVLKICIELE